MLLNPLTHPQDPSTPPSSIGTYNGNGVTSFTVSDSYSLLGHSTSPEVNAFAPVAASNMGLDTRDERTDSIEHAESYDSPDEDQDMSDGGADLTMTLSHAEVLNTDMDLLDAEIMGPDNLADLHLDTSMVVTDYNYPYDYSLAGSQQFQGIHPPAAESELMSTPNLAEVAQHLQHIQDGQEHVEMELATDDQHGAFAHTSTHPFLLPYIPHFQEIHGTWVSPPTADHFSLSDTSPTPSTPANSLPPPLGWSIGELPPGAATNGTGASHLSFAEMAWEDGSDADQNEVEDRSSLTLGDFLQTWAVHAESSRNGDSRKRIQGPSLSTIGSLRSVKKIEQMRRYDLQGDCQDVQRLDWVKLGVSRAQARAMRRQTYSNYTNGRAPYPWHPGLNGARLLDRENYFKFRQMDFNHKAHLTHFQLRNLISCVSRDHIFYTGRSKILRYNPTGSKDTPASVVMNLENPTVQSSHASHYQGGTQISTLAAGHDILIAGGFCGEYALTNLKSHKSTKHVEGLLTDEANSITNHIQVNLSRSSSLPIAAFASNDQGFRILDVNTNQIIAEHKYAHAINCSAISPDQRLRVMVGDTRQVMICNSDTGEILQSLEGHRDFGFACDWADDGWTVATGNQDMQIKIWDARKWTSSSGVSEPVTTIAAEMGGVRKLRFSPVGSGKKVLVAAEPCDFVNIIDAQSFTSKQSLDFFGEIGGFDFSNNGQDLLVANCDPMRGGIMHFERSDLAGDDRHQFKNIDVSDLVGYGQHGFAASKCADLTNDALRGTVRKSACTVRAAPNKPRPRSSGHDWLSEDEDLACHPKARGTVTGRKRKAAELGISIGHF